MDVLPGHPLPGHPERAYELLAAYRLALGYVGGKSVVNLGWEDVWYGSQLLARSAGHVAGLSGSDEGLSPLDEPYPAPNVEYSRVNLPAIPYPEGYFDAAVALRVIERLRNPGELLVEVKRTLKPGGLCIISTPDKQAYSNDRNHREPSHRRELYVPELRELLGRWFENVRLYRLGAVAGGVVFEESAGLEGLEIEGVGSTLTAPVFGAAVPTPMLVVAVCADAEIPAPDHPLLFLDLDRRIFEEYGDRNEDVELLREEIRRMQETEVQAFRDALKVRAGEISYLNARLEQLEAHKQTFQDRAKALRARNEQLERHLRELEDSNTWRLLAPYRNLRSRLNSKKH